MYDDFFSKAHKLIQAGIPFATATVVRAEKPTSGKPGDRAIITTDGTLYGWIGGSCAQPTVVQEALRALAEDECRLIRLSTDNNAQHARDGVIDLPMTCFSGGTMEIYIEPQQPRPRLLIVGTLPVAQALANLARAMSYHVIGLDMDDEQLSNANEVIPSLGEVARYITPSTYVVVATHGNYDEAALEHLLRCDAAYLGLVASARRAESVRDYLKAQGFDDNALAALKAPAGLDIHARRGDEIALSIMAEIVMRRRGHERIEMEAADMAQTPMSPPTPSNVAWDISMSAPPADPAVALDPICKMKVTIATANYHSTYEGQDFYFCCAGCKRTFDENPEAYVPIHHPELDAPQSAVAIDPICHMTVDIATAKYHSDYEGANYYFCCAGCKRTFDANPTLYMMAP